MFLKGLQLGIIYFFKDLLRSEYGLNACELPLNAIIALNFLSKYKFIEKTKVSEHTEAVNLLTLKTGLQFCQSFQN